MRHRDTSGAANVTMSQSIIESCPRKNQTSPSFEGGGTLFSETQMKCQETQMNSLETQIKYPGSQMKDPEVQTIQMWCQTGGDTCSDITARSGNAMDSQPEMMSVPSDTMSNRGETKRDILVRIHHSSNGHLTASNRNHSPFIGCSLFRWSVGLPMKYLPYPERREKRAEPGHTNQRYKLTNKTARKEKGR